MGLCPTRASRARGSPANIQDMILPHFVLHEKFSYMYDVIYWQPNLSERFTAVVYGGIQN